MLWTTSSGPTATHGSGGSNVEVAWLMPSNAPNDVAAGAPDDRGLDRGRRGDCGDRRRAEAARLVGRAAVRAVRREVLQRLRPLLAGVRLERLAAKPVDGGLTVRVGRAGRCRAGEAGGGGGAARGDRGRPDESERGDRDENAGERPAGAAVRSKHEVLHRQAPAPARSRWRAGGARPPTGGRGRGPRVHGLPAARDVT